MGGLGVNGGTRSHGPASFWWHWVFYSIGNMFSMLRHVINGQISCLLCLNDGTRRHGVNDRTGGTWHLIA